MSFNCLSIRVFNICLISCMLILIFASSCNNGEQKKKAVRSKDLKEPLIEANKHVVKTEAHYQARSGSLPAKGK